MYCKPVCTLFIAFMALATAGAGVEAHAAKDNRSALQRIVSMQSSGMMIDPEGPLSIQHNADQPMIPASTIKLVTALAALERWGRDYHFSTEFYLDNSQRLWVKGKGDPYLDSYELGRMVDGLRCTFLPGIKGVGADGSYFSTHLDIPGRSDTFNPYDAPVTGLSFNFNNVALRVHDKNISSADPRAPLTSVGTKIGSIPRIGKGDFRASVKTGDNALQHAGELIYHKLVQSDIPIEGDVVVGEVPADAERVYIHRSRKSLEDVIAYMLRYSNNIIANSLFLDLAAQQDGWPVDIDSAQRQMQAWLRSRFGWNNFTISDGAGLSRENAVSPRQLLQVVEAFAPYRDLLRPQRNDRRVRAKTGTLKGVVAYAGFAKKGDAWVPFSLMINQKSGNSVRYELATQIANTGNLAGFCDLADCRRSKVTASKAQARKAPVQHPDNPGGA
jgi:D-alanyl-D-alanine carboxypeptidase/D-alanyl-D-alanine-endopeptidase (penicillin-binding protein 4)